MFPFFGIIIALAIAYGVGYLSHQPTDRRSTHPGYKEAVEGHWKARTPCVGMRGREESDLCAQWVAATAATKSSEEASRATGWAIAGVLASLLTVVGLIATIAQTSGALREARRGNILSMRENARATRRSLESARETARAVTAAVRGADATSKHAELAERAARAQLRAYMVVDRIETSIFLEEEILIKVFLRNAGETPAKILGLRAGIILEFVGEFDKADKYLRPEYIQQWIPHNSSDYFYVSVKDNEKIGKINDTDRTDIFVAGRLDYEDAFGSNQWLEFVYTQVGYSGARSGKYRPHIFGNSAS